MTSGSRRIRAWVPARARRGSGRSVPAKGEARLRSPVDNTTAVICRQPVQCYRPTVYIGERRNGGSYQQDRNRGLAAVALAAVAGAAALPITSVGIGWPISALAIAAAVWATRTAGDVEHESTAEDESTARGEARADRAWRLAAGAAALVLSVMPAVRASEVLALLCVGSAVLLGSYALAGGRTWRGIAAGALALVPGLIRGLGWAASHTAGPTRRAGRIAGAVLTGLVLLAVFVPLLRSADPAFANLLDATLRDLSRF